MALGEEMSSNTMAVFRWELCPYCETPWPAARLWNARTGPCHDEDIFTFRSVTFCVPWCENQQYVIPLVKEGSRKRALRVILRMVYECAQLQLRERERALIHQ